MSYDEPKFLISVVSKRLQIHPQTLRQYEREGLIEPGRTGGKVRIYSQRDVERIELILRFTRDLGVNLAGVGVILQLKEQIEHYESLLRAQGLAPNAELLEQICGASACEEQGAGEAGGAVVCKSSSEIMLYERQEK